MKKIITNKIGLGILSIVIFSVSVLFSCNDNNDAGGTPVILSVHKLDTFATHRDSTFAAAEAGNLLVVHGQNIGGVRHAYFNEYETSFNTNYNTNTDLIISVPGDAPVDSTANNTLKLVTSHGEATFTFKIIAKPIIYTRNNAFFGGSRRDVTFTGKNFADMIDIYAVRQRDSTEIITDSVLCTIVSKKATEIVVRIPDNTMSRVVLKFKNTSGTIVTEPFVNATLALPFYDDKFGQFISDYDPANPGTFSGDSWGNPLKENSDVVLNGTKSLSIAIAAKADPWFGFTNWWPRYFHDKKYKYFAFAFKGGTTSFPLWISSEVTKAGGIGGYPAAPYKNGIEIAPNVWNYYLIAIKDMDFVYPGVEIPRLGFRPKEKLVTIDQTLYLDDVMMVE